MSIPGGMIHITRCSYCLARIRTCASPSARRLSSITDTHDEITAGKFAPFSFATENTTAKSYISGITFSGGDPLHPANRIDVREFAHEVRQKYPDKTIWLYTGDSWENIYHYPLMKDVDVVVDGEFQYDKMDVTLMWKGSSNQRVIDVQKTLASTDPVVPVLHCQDYYKG